MYGFSIVLCYPALLLSRASENSRYPAFITADPGVRGQWLPGSRSKGRVFHLCSLQVPPLKASIPAPAHRPLWMTECYCQRTPKLQGLGGPSEGTAGGVEGTVCPPFECYVAPR